MLVGTTGIMGFCTAGTIGQKNRSVGKSAPVAELFVNNIRATETLKAAISLQIWYFSRELEM